LVNDPLNTLAQGETHLFDGGGSQTSTSGRWGDYSSMNVDPVDDCTFWYTTEILSNDWHGLGNPNREFQIRPVRFHSARSDHQHRLEPNQRKLQPC
jgi:hypothetical protein